MRWTTEYTGGLKGKMNTGNCILKLGIKGVGMKDSTNGMRRLVAMVPSINGEQRRIQIKAAQSGSKNGKKNSRWMAIGRGTQKARLEE